MRRVRGTTPRIALLGAALLALTACSGGGDANGTGAATGSTGPAATTTASVAPPSSTAAGSSASPSAVARKTSSAPAPCPYLDTGFVMETVGQHISASTVTTTAPAEGPLPRCAFQRSSGETVAAVQTVTKASAAAAYDAALKRVPGGNPVSDIGDGGAVLVGTGETTLAVAVGTTLLVVEINQESSLEATTLAAQVATKL